MQNSDEQFQRQIQYILNQLAADPVDAEQDQEDDKNTHEMDDEEEEEDDEYGGEEGEEGTEEEYEEDGEYNDTIKIEGVPIGEELLAGQFVLSNDEQAMQQTMTITRRMEEQREQRLNHSAISDNSRPVTSLAAEGNPFNVSKMGYANPAA